MGIQVASGLLKESALFGFVGVISTFAGSTRSGCRFKGVTYPRVNLAVFEPQTTGFSCPLSELGLASFSG